MESTRSSSSSETRKYYAAAGYGLLILDIVTAQFHAIFQLHFLGIYFNIFSTLPLIIFFAATKNHEDSWAMEHIHKSRKYFIAYLILCVISGVLFEPNGLGFYPGRVYFTYLMFPVCIVLLVLCAIQLVNIFNSTTTSESAMEPTRPFTEKTEPSLDESASTSNDSETAGPDAVSEASVVNTVTAANSQSLSALQTICHINYALQATSYFIGITVLVALVLAYIKLDDARGTYYEQHLRWQIQSFWRGLLLLIALVVVGGIFVLVTFGIGYLIVAPLIIAWFIWTIYRIAKGWIYLADNKQLFNLYR